MALVNSGIYDMNQYLGSVYFIPNYQREYSWEEEQLEDFWDDLILSSTNEIREHFFGQIVIHKDEQNGNTKYIIDGQQRTITTVILLSVFKKEFDKIYEQDKAFNKPRYNSDDIISKHIGREDELHLTLGELDREYFKEYIQLGEPANKKETKESHERIRYAYYYFVDRLSEEINSFLDLKSKFERLNILYKTLIDKFKVLYMEATDLNEAFIIFETLNARGKELETSDLLKNYILSRSTNVNNALNKWNLMISSLDGLDTTKYIRHFWNSREKFTREKALYKRITSLLQSSGAYSCDDFLVKLSDISPYYNDIACPDNCVKYSDSKLIKHLTALKMMKASTFYPVILAMQQANKYDESAISNVLEVIEVLAFRNFAICNKTANSAEVYFADLAKDIYNNQIPDVDAICAKIRTEMVDDKEFQTSFSTLKSKNKELIRYIFRRIHKYLDPNQQEINVDNNVVHIEHIMPIDNTQWNIDETIHDEYLWRLGNLALLAQKLNAKIKAKPFAEKKEEYKKSIIKPNDKLLEYDAWNSKTIESRQQELSELAIKIWAK